MSCNLLGSCKNNKPNIILGEVSYVSNNNINSGNSGRSGNNGQSVNNNNETKYINKINKINNILSISSNSNIKITKNGPQISSNLPPKSCSFLSCTDIYTGTPNFKNFLSFLNYYGEFNKNTNIYVVSHSHAMQNFLKENSIEPGYLTEQNLWSIVLNRNNTNNTTNNTITLTRHAFSIANVAKAKSKALIKINQISEKDAALSMYGILSAYKKQMEGAESVTTIYVSPLIRTWMTGVCLYLKKCEEDVFTIVISPYIIEDGGVLSRDNIPREFSEQIQYFEIFLNILQKINNKYRSISSYENKNIFVYDGRSNKMCEFKFNKRIWTGSIKPNRPYFQNINGNKKFLTTTFMKLLPGVNKPGKDALKKISRWCEPLAMKGRFNYNGRRESICKERLKKLNKLNKLNSNNLESIRLSDELSKN